MSIWDGWGDYRLSERGLQQAEAAARWLSFERLGRVVSSDVPRTIQTAQCLMNMGNVECPMMYCEPNLRPWNVSTEFTGKEKTPEMIARFKPYLDDLTKVIEGGESGQQLCQRVQVIWQYICAPYKGLPTACFIHNSVIKALMGLLTIRDAVDPGGIIGVYMDEKGEIDFQVLLGETNFEKGVS